MAFVNREQAEFWSQLAPTWLKFEDQLEEVGGPPGQLAMDRLKLLSGQRVVDLGCGSGRTTLELASRVEPGGEVVGVDIAAEMLACGRERAARLGIKSIEFLHADIQAQDLGEARFDAAYSRFGRDVLLRPGGRLRQRPPGAPAPGSAVIRLLAERLRQ